MMHGAIYYQTMSLLLGQWHYFRRYLKVRFSTQLTPCSCPTKLNILIVIIKIPPPLNWDLVESIIKEEMVHCNYVMDKPKNIISALGGYPKHNGKIRLIHDARMPLGGCWNYITSGASCNCTDLREGMCSDKPRYFCNKCRHKKRRFPWTACLSLWCLAAFWG